MSDVPGSFIVFEGLDGAGTTTQTARLVDRLRGVGRRARATREPSDGPIGVQIRQALGHRLRLPDGEALTPETIALLFAADRLDHLAAEVAPSLAAGTTIVSDRYVHSSLAYQGVDCDQDWVAEINREARTADLVIFVDTPVDVCVARIASRGGTQELFERRETLEATKAGFERALQQRDEPVARIDGTQPIDAVEEAVWRAVVDVGLAT